MTGRTPRDKPTKKPAPKKASKAAKPSRSAADAKRTTKARAPAKAAPPKMETVPEFVKQASPVERKAALESIVRSDPVLSAPVPTWRRAENPIPQPTKRHEPVPLPVKATDVGRSPPRYVILDTNALMMQFQFHIDLENELKRILDFQYEIVVPSTVKDELSALAHEGAGKDAAEARMALELAKTFKEMASGVGDPGILRLAEELGAIVVTNDKILRARLRAKDVPNVHMRSKAFLTLEGHIRGL